MNSKAWTEAALLTVACVLPDWRVVTKASCGVGEALMVLSDHLGGVPECSKDTARDAEGTALAILQAMLVARPIG